MGLSRMNLSLGEVEALAVKATRGAGLGWGIAVEAGKAVRWLTAHGFDGPRTLAHALGASEFGVVEVDGNRLTGGSAVLLGPSLCDLKEIVARGEDIVLVDVHAAPLIAPFVARLSGLLETRLALAWAEAGIVFTPDAVLAHEDGAVPPDFCAELRVGGCDDVPECEPLLKSSRAEISQDIFDALSGYAARTYAPATEESRLAGAGAGLTDND